MKTMFLVCTTGFSLCDILPRARRRLLHFLIARVPVSTKTKRSILCHLLLFHFCHDRKCLCDYFLTSMSSISTYASHVDVTLSVMTGALGVTKSIQFFQIDLRLVPGWNERYYDKRSGEPEIHWD